MAIEHEGRYYEMASTKVGTTPIGNVPVEVPAGIVGTTEWFDDLLRLAKKDPSQFYKDWLKGAKISVQDTARREYKKDSDMFGDKQFQEMYDSHPEVVEKGLSFSEMQEELKRLWQEENPNSSDYNENYVWWELA